MQDANNKIKEFKEELKSLEELLKIGLKKQNITALQSKMSEPNFWQNQKEASKIIEELKSAKGDVDDWDLLNNKLNELDEFVQIADSSYEGDVNKEAKKLEDNFEKLKLRVLFCDKFDSASAILEINAGAGGTEACDWVSILFRMYFRFAERMKFKFSVLDELKGEEAGIKNITFFIEGLRAYGLLKSERGVHRLVRISPFDANKRRHTSFASVNILPEIKDEVDIEIKPEDIEMETCRSSGAGGQHVNKTESAVRIRHLPTGIVVGCRNERSQHQNKAVALSVLKAKLYERNEEAKQKNLDKVSGEKRKIEWGSQIRSYVLYPYLLVKDHRTDLESHDAWGVLDGKIEDFIYAYLKQSKC